MCPLSTSVGTQTPLTACDATHGVKPCWGYNSLCQIGNGQCSGRTAPTVVDLPEVVAIGLGSGHICAVTSDGAAWCWGSDGGGQLGNGAGQGSSPYPTAVTSAGGPFIDIDGGAAHTCATLASGGAQCWGYGTSGHLGQGSNTSSQTPVDVLP